MKVILEKEKCIGCGSCAAICPKHFNLAEDGKSELLGSEKNPQTGNLEKEVEQLECIQEAAESCPAQIIHIEK